MTTLFARYGRLAGVLACVVLGLSFVPPFTVGGNGVNATAESFGSVWDMATTPAGDPARGALALLIILVGSLFATALSPTTPVLPAISAFAAILVGVLLWTRPNTGHPVPYLSAAGKADLAVVAVIVVVCALHLRHLLRLRRAGVGRGIAEQPHT